MAYYDGHDLMRFAGLMGQKEQPYWYATFCQHCTQDLYNRKSAQYPTHYDHGTDYARDIEEQYVCTDCVGLLKGFFWAGPGGWRKILNAIGNVNAEIPLHYQGYGVPDYSADQMYSYFCNKVGEGNFGSFDTLPRDKPCLMLHSPGHCGIYVGNEYSVEASSLYTHVIYLPIDNRRGAAWTGWTKFPPELIEDKEYKPYDPTHDPYFIMNPLMWWATKRKIGGVYGYGKY